jgi:hypothetical protein
VSEGDEANGALQRGLVILESLAQENRLNAEQLSWIPMFRDKLAMSLNQIEMLGDTSESIQA